MLRSFRRNSGIHLRKMPFVAVIVVSIITTAVLDEKRRLLLGLNIARIPGSA